LVALSQRVRAWLDAFDVRLAVHAARLAEQGSCEPASALLSGGGRRSAREADAAARRATVCADLTEVHDALACGRMSAGHVDAVARLAGELDDAARAELHDLQAAVVQSAVVMPVETFEREMSKLGRILSGDDGMSRIARLRQQRCVRRWVDRVSGMCHTRSWAPAAPARGHVVGVCGFMVVVGSGGALLPAVEAGFLMVGGPG
jgi:hypothetical protein